MNLAFLDQILKCNLSIHMNASGRYAAVVNLFSQYPANNFIFPLLLQREERLLRETRAGIVCMGCFFLQQHLPSVISENDLF